MAACAILHIALCLYVGLFKPEFGLFTLAVIGINVCLSTIDALAEGISSIVSKLDVNILKLETMLKERESQKIGLAFDKGDTIA